VKRSVSFKPVVLAVFALFALAAAPLADPLPKGFTNHKLNPGKGPNVADGVISFHIDDEKCSKTDYGDGRGENDCHNGNVRQMLGMNREAKMGEAWSYKFDVWVDPSFDYRGFTNDDAFTFIPRRADSRLRIASWEGQYLHNFLYMLKLETDLGLSFLGKTCQPTTAFGSLVTFEMRVFWSNDTKGWINVSCDGTVIYEKKDVATNQAPHCWITNQCEPGKKKNPSRVYFALGPVMAGFGPEWKKFGLASQFTKIQPDGITIKMRNVSVTPIAR